MVYISTYVVVLYRSLTRHVIAGMHIVNFTVKPKAIKFGTITDCRLDVEKDVFAGGQTRSQSKGTGEPPHSPKFLGHGTTNGNQTLRGLSQSHLAKSFYDRGTTDAKFALGSKVMLHNAVTKKGECRKLKKRWVGPFLVV